MPQWENVTSVSIFPISKVDHTAAGLLPAYKGLKKVGFWLPV